MLALLMSCGSKEQSAEIPVAVFMEEAILDGNVVAKEFPGRVKPSEEINMSFKIPGTVTRILVSEGQHVSKGQLIAEMDDRDYRLQADAAEAEYQNVMADAKRVMALYADSATTADNYDKARYGLARIEAKYRNAANALADTKIYSPVDGKVMSRMFDTPAVIGAGMPVVSIVSGKTPEIEIHIPASDYLRLGDLLSLTASFDFIPSDVPVRVIEALPKANANQLYTVRLALPTGLSPAPAPGMNTSVKALLLSDSDDAVSVPEKSVFSRDGKQYVWIVQPDSTLRKRAVTVERLTSDGRAVLSSGLSAGEIFVSAGVNSLKENIKVRRQEKASESNPGGLL